MNGWVIDTGFLTYAFMITIMFSCRREEGKNDTSHANLMEHWSYEGETTPEH